MTTYDIKLYQTQSLYTAEGTTPMDRAETYIDASFQYLTHDANVYKGTSYPEMYDDEGTDHSDNCGYTREQTTLDSQLGVTHPCTGDSISYDGIAFYFRDWLNCNDNPSDYDVIALLTACDPGGGHALINGSWSYSICASTGGNHIADAPSTFRRYEPKDDSSSTAVAIDAIQTLHHEIGHCLMHDDEKDHDDHNVGDLTKRDGDYWWRTPMGFGGDSSSVCGSFDTTGHGRWDVVWSDCCVNRWEDTLG